MKKLIPLLLATLLLTGCSRAFFSTIHSIGAVHKIVLYAADGHVIDIWYSTGAIEAEQGGLCYFQDDSTGLPVYIYGTFIVTIEKH